ncbi:DUF58 domain-containing protein [Micromonospora echinospora]|uniref:Uncharacterized conserved protein, DUF58 family, contains vWF domain n=1 Tax=Micromonospora echinospora TaxID=1877 RepID=A0A1C4YQL5_MICEC|nr:DUF58 domain-containing protein [Micromonospora echinospora]OZV73628.1 DUF58 domain-containing protein [Micromonospora echinospora]SCF23072.1 Uncharacterized conserved protein, DUF58 family, contains vWF domain [Micromonospora echinospora]
MGITARGVGLLVATVALLAAGFAFAYPELTVLGAAAGTAVGYALVVAARRPRLTVTRHADPDRVARGEPARMSVTVRNAGRLRAASLVAEDRCGGRAVPVPLLRLRPGRDTTVTYDVPTSRRGVVPIGPLRVIRRDPLGLVALSRSYGDTVPVWVHPRVHPLTAVPTGAGRSLDGRVDGVPHGSITFDSLREYVVGDELRRVHWRTSARVGELMVRENVDTSLPRIVVLLDNRVEAHPDRADGTAESFESGCEAAASVVAAAIQDDLPVTLLTVVPDDDADAHPLDRLTSVGLATGSLPDATTRLRQQRAGDTLVFLTGPGGRAGLGHVGALRGAYPSVVVAVFGAADATPADGAGLVVIDAVDGAAFAAEWDGVRRW